MAFSAAKPTALRFTTPAIPWLVPKPLDPLPVLGPGLDPQRYRTLLGSPGVGVDLIVAGAADAARLSGSRWHVFGDVAREGKVLHVGS